METTEKRIQKFRCDEGYIICVKCGWIAVDIPPEWRITDVEMRGTSTKIVSGKAFSYYDIALNGSCVLHIFRMAFDETMPYGLQTFFFDKYPF